MSKQLVSKDSTGKIFCLVGPSGSGKSSICKELIKTNKDLFLSISTTTRQPRKGEVEGVNYFFVSKKEFEDRIESDSFLEFAQYRDNLYGTEKKNIELASKANKTLVLDIEYQGVLKLRKEHDVVAIFVSAPSKEILTQRLRARQDTSEEEIQSRLLTAQSEVRQLLDNKVADYLVVNNNFSTALKEVEGIIGGSFEDKKIENYYIQSYSKDELDKIRLT